MSKRSQTMTSKGGEKISFNSFNSSMDILEGMKNVDDDQLSNIIDGKDDSPVKLLKQFISAKEILQEENMNKSEYYP